MLVLKKLWSDDRGFVASTELVLLATVLVIGLLVGMVSLRDATVSELADVTQALQSVNQSYGYDGLVGHNSATHGSTYADLLDECDINIDIDSTFASCIVTISPVPEQTPIIIP
jgi:hypothetical protein